MGSWIRRTSILFVLAIAACNTSPMYNVDRASFNSTRPLSNEEAAKVILDAGAKLGWSMRQVRDGLIRGDLHVRKHQAIVDIAYDGRGYSINYVDSQNLKYDPTKGSIHRNYNSWIQNLERQIRVESSAV